jgi:AraC-like DNA-binding protein
MLVAHGQLRVPTERGAVTLDFDIALEQAFRVLSVRREGTIWDSRLTPPNGGRSEAHVVHLLLEGSVEWHDPGARTLNAPAAYVAPLAQVEGTAGRRVRTFRTNGSPFVAVELHVAPAELTIAPDERTVIEMSPALFDAATRYAALVHSPHAERVERDARVRALGRTLRDDGILARDLGTTIKPNEGVYGVMWNALAPFVERMALSPSLAALSARTGFSAGQLDRRVADFLSGLRLPWPGWRDVTRGLRLRVAVLLLSSSDVPLREVARRAGYSSPEALSHALTTEGLPPPLELRRRILANEG